MRALMLTLPLLALGTAPAAAQTLTPAQIQRIDSVLAPFDHTDRPGCSLGISQNGRLIYQRGYGMSNLELGVAITPPSIFHVASISKEFTAFAVGLLADDGKLSIDDDIHKYIPELPDYGKPITLRHLMYHTSGIRDQWELLGMAGWRDDVDLVTEGDILEIVTHQKELNFAPGEEYLYSNSGYTLLAIVVKRVSGQRLREFAAERIFKPLGMNDTHFHNDHTFIVPNRTGAYVARPGGGWAISLPVFDNDGATSLQTTAADLLKWEQNFVDGKVGSRHLIDEAMTSGHLNNGKSINYGFGLSVGTYRGVKWIGHGGADAGYRADVVRYPDEGLAIAVLCNFGEATPGVYSRHIADVLLEGKLAPAKTAAAPATPVQLSQADLEAVAGSYKNPKSDEAWLFVVKDGKLVLSNFDVPLTAVGPRRFTLFGMMLEFTTPANGPMVARLIGDGDGEGVGYEKMTPPKATPKDLAAFVGEYWSPEIGVTYRIVPTDSGLVLKRRKFDDAPLVPIYADGFSTGVGTLRFVRAGGKPTGPVTGFRVTGGRVRRVEFVKVTTGRW